MSENTVPAPPTPASLPTPIPQRSGTQVNFTSAGNNFIDALPQFISDISAAMQWIKNAIDAVEQLSETESEALSGILEELEAAKNNALGSLNLVLEEIENASSEVGDIEAEIEALKNKMLDDIEDAKNAAIADVEAMCGGGD